MDFIDEFGLESLDMSDYKPLKSYKVYGDFLARSNEVYFGRTAPLSLVLMKYSKELKDLLGNPNIKYNFKDKNFVNKIKRICDNFGKEIANEINAEKCTVVVELDKNVNAYCYPLITCFDNRPVDKDGNIIEGKVDLDKYIDIENIVQTKAGYKFKKSKSKLLFVSISIGLLWKGTPEEISGIICHELGHCFQQGIFGSYKNYSDLMYQQEIKNLGARFDGGFSSLGSIGKMIFTVLSFPISFMYKILCWLIAFIFNPSCLNINIFTKLNLVIHNALHNRIEDKRFMMKDKVESDDWNDKTKKYSQSIIIDLDREKEFKKNEKDIYKSYKKADLYKNEKQAVGSKFIKMMNTIAFDINNKQENFLQLITLSRYAQNKYSQQVFYQKYEYFADIFASAYGFGPNLYNILIDSDTDFNKKLESIFNSGIYKVPFIKAIALYNAYQHMRDISSVDEHGESYQRASAMYTNLINEIKNNPDLTKEQKEAIKADCDMYKKLDDKYYQDNKKKGVLYKLYNKMLTKKITQKSEKVEDLVLGPILEVAKETSNEKIK